jgi:hypothetical protein
MNSRYLVLALLIFASPALAGEPQSKGSKARFADAYLPSANRDGFLQGKFGVAYHVTPKARVLAMASRDRLRHENIALIVLRISLF